MGSLSRKNDLVNYLNDRYEDLTNEHFHILLRWKLNANKYKIVFQIVKDMLAIQVLTVASKFAFSISDRILDSFRSLLST